MNYPMSQNAMRNAFLNGCEGKRAYGSMGHALQAQAVTTHIAPKRKDIGGCVPYRCQFCGSWHLGHNKFGEKA